LIAIVLTILPFFYLGVLLKHPARKRSNERSSASSFINNSKRYYTVIGLTVSVFIMTIFMLSKISYTNNIITYSIRSIDIVKPYLEDKNSNLILSKFYQIRSKSDFNDFDANLKKIAKEHSLKLPENKTL
jgi:hypothetical protein